MSFKDQLHKLKENWLLILLVVLVLLFSSFSSIISPLSRVSSYGSYDNSYESSSAPSFGKMMAANRISASYSESYYPSPMEESFAPEVTDRKITTTVSLTTQIERGEFSDKNAEVKNFVAVNKGLILSQDEQRYGEGRRTARSASYSIKVPVSGAPALVQQLRNLGEVQSFSENAQDITGAYQNNEIELGVERERLQRYEKMFAEATIIADKIDLNDRIFNQERTIKYLEDSLKNKDAQVQYTTIYFNLQEKASSYIEVVFVKFSELLRNLVESVNGLLSLLFWALPWVVVAGVVWFVVRRLKRRK